MIYVASSWRNSMHTGVVQALRAAGLICYDFKEDPGAGFNWSEIMPGYLPDGLWTSGDYLMAMRHPRAQMGFRNDYRALRACDTCVLVLPCGKSAHLELGWAVGHGKKTAILLDEPIQPELMYGMVDYLAPSLLDLLGWLGVKD